MTKHFKLATISAYLNTAAWLNHEDGGKLVSEGGKTARDFPLSEWRKAARIVLRFLDRAGEAILPGVFPSTVGTDLWLTQAGHGAGFWDGDWGDQGDALTRAADFVHDIGIYEGDDGHLYFI